MATPLQRLGRAAGLGLAGGLLTAAVLLLLRAALALRVDCAGRSPTECTFEQDLAHAVARSQALEALGLFLVGAGLALWLRRRPAR